MVRISQACLHRKRLTAYAYCAGKVMFPMKQYHEAKQGKFIRDPEARRRFQEHDKHVLRFDCVWDNSAAEHGDVHHVVLQYFLADDMVEVRRT